MYYNARTSLEDMWQGNPVLTAVLFGLPLGFLSLICYSIWCSDILDADDDGKLLALARDILCDVYVYCFLLSVLFHFPTFIE